MNLLSIYSIPFWQSEYPEFEKNKEIFSSIISNYKKQNPTIKDPISNVCGYQSPPTLHHVKKLTPLFEYICQMALKASSDLNFINCDIAIASAWLNINYNRRCMNREHVHVDVFSGVFYLKVPKNSGKIIFPNIALNRMWSGCFLHAQKNQFTAESTSIEPVEGNILLFPSYLPHSVETNNHDEERISISFNLTALPKRYH